MRRVGSIDRPAVTEDESAIERSFRSQSEKLWRSLLLFTGDAEIASDAVAEAFAQALRRGDAIRDIDPWVWRVAFTLARGELQRRRRTRFLPDMPVEMPESTVDLVRALGRLSPKQRGAVILRLYAGYSAEEAARTLGTSASAVGTHLQRARARLRRELGETDG
jgi:RNA polymerase sigma factor (sigma-70 family)